jgi:hypothetical protein
VPEPRDFNAKRIARAMSERRFYLGPYTFRRKPTIPLAVITDFARVQQEATTPGVDSPNVVLGFEQIFHDIVEAECWRTSDPLEAKLPTPDAWLELTTIGDENGPVGMEDLAALVEWLLEGATETPTEEPPASLDGSSTPPNGTPSTLASSSEDATSTSSTPAAP